MNQEELKVILENHLHWINEDCDGWETMRADLMEADLRGANLFGAYLRGANLRGANLKEVNLIGANLREADLREADLKEANLIGADLREADLREAKLAEADLRGADLKGANLFEAEISIEALNKVLAICCPEEGEFIGWKNANNKIVKLKITEDAKRSSATTRKCRCSKAIVLAIENIDGSSSGLSEVRSNFDKSFIYKVGDTIEIKDFDEDRKNECSTGIHFFITRQEAVDYAF